MKPFPGSLAIPRALRRDIESNARKLNSSPDEISGALNGLRKATWEALSDRLFNITEEGVSVKGNPTKTLRDLRGTLESSGLFNKDQMDMMEFTARTLARRDAARFTSQGVENLAGLGDNTILGNVAGYLGARGGAIIGGGAGAQLRTAAKLSKMFDKLATKAGKQTFMQLLGEALEPTPAGRALLRTLFSEAGDLKAQGNILSAFEMMARTGLPFGLGTSTAFTAQQEFGIEARDQLTDQPQAEE